MCVCTLRIAVTVPMHASFHTECYRTLADAEQLEFYVHRYPVMANQAGFNASKEVSEAFVFEHLQPYSEALM